MFAAVTIKSPVAETIAFRSRTPRRRSQGEPADSAGLRRGYQTDLPRHQPEARFDGRSRVRSRWGPQDLGLLLRLPAQAEGQPGEVLGRLAPPPRGEVLSVPESAVIDTGNRKVVYVESEPGVFEGAKSCSDHASAIASRCWKASCPASEWRRPAPS